MTMRNGVDGGGKITASLYYEYDTNLLSMHALRLAPCSHPGVAGQMTCFHNGIPIA